MALQDQVKEAQFEYAQKSMKREVVLANEALTDAIRKSGQPLFGDGDIQYGFHLERIGSLPRFVLCEFDVYDHGPMCALTDGVRIIERAGDIGMELIDVRDYKKPNPDGTRWLIPTEVRDALYEMMDGWTIEEVYRALNKYGRKCEHNITP